MVVGINPPLVRLKRQERLALRKAAELDSQGCWPQAQFFRDQAHFCRVAQDDEIRRTKVASQ